MTQTPVLPNWFVTNDIRDKAQVKYELNYLEGQLNKYFELYNGLVSCPDEITSLCARLTNKYLDYLKLIGDKNKSYSFEPLTTDVPLTWGAQLTLIINLMEQAHTVFSNEEKIAATHKLASLNHHFVQKNQTAATLQNDKALVKEFSQLLLESNLKIWLHSLVKLTNQNGTKSIEIAPFFQQWSIEQRTMAIAHCSQAEVVNLINSIFFYKLYPDKLFNELIHPEKLVSVRMRLGSLHHSLELLQSQLFNLAQQYGLTPGVDYLFHGDELPQGIMIEVNEEYRGLIQSAIKNLKIQVTLEDELQVTLERLHDLGYAYKFWFNPNRLIDAVMVLQQRLVKEETSKENKLVLFHEEMVILYSHLTTTECLNLYGYFANNDSRYLLYTLFTIIQGSDLEWLPSLDVKGRSVIADVFEALQCVMESLRIALKTRHVSTDSYVYNLDKQEIRTGRRNREAVFRILAIYGREEVTMSETVEKLFTCIEETT